MANFEVSYSPNYFSIDDILASQSRVTCKFEKSAKGLGKWLNFNISFIYIIKRSTLG